jgi:hypothetical protein
MPDSAEREPEDLRWATPRRRSAGAELPPGGTEADDGRAAAQPSARRLALAQGAFYLVTGVWPVLHLRSFLAVTGPKTDLWLVQTVGSLLAVIGGGLLLSARRREIAVDVRWTAAGSALVLALVDVVFVSRHVIGPIYLADGAVEAGLVIAWAVLTWRRRANENS